MTSALTLLGQKAPAWCSLALMVTGLATSLSTGCSTVLEPEEEPPPVVIEPPPLLTVVTPLDGLAYTDADDADGALPGLQVPVRVRVNDLELGYALSEVELTMPDGRRRTAAITETGEGRYAVWPTVTVLAAPGQTQVHLHFSAGPSLDEVEHAEVRFRARYDGLAVPHCPVHLAWEGDLEVLAPEDLPGADGCLTVTGNLRITTSPLTGLSGLGGLIEVGGDLDVIANPALEDLDELFALRRVGGALRVLDNPALPTEDAERLVERIGLANVGGAVAIAGNAAD